jgi:hypothetical protein
MTIVHEPLTTINITLPQLCQQADTWADDEADGISMPT